MNTAVAKGQWHVLENLMPSDNSPDPRRRLLICFHQDDHPTFGQAELRATIRVLGLQGKPTALYEAGLAALVELEGVKGEEKRKKTRD
jgi:hypothetical protein